MTGTVTGPPNWDHWELLLARRANPERCVLLRVVGEDLLFDLWSVISNRRANPVSFMAAC